MYGVVPVVLHCFNSALNSQPGHRAVVTFGMPPCLTASAHPECICLHGQDCAPDADVLVWHMCTEGRQCSLFLLDVAVN